MKTAKTLIVEFILLEEARDALHIATNEQKKELKIIIVELEQMHHACCLLCEIAQDDDSDCGV